MLRAEGITKVYDPPSGLLRLAVRSAATTPVVALHGVDFEVRAGEVVGLVGPNGAGKSTLIRICASLLTPTSGRVTIGGTDIAERPAGARAAIGLLLADERALYWRLTGRENLRFFGVMAGLPRVVARRRADELLERFDLAERDRLVFGYSSGMRVRLGLARALLAEPDLLILDEPSRSLDPVASSELLELLGRLASDGMAILLSSHRLDEVESICDRVLVLVDGRQRAWVATTDLDAGQGATAKALREMLEPEGDTR
jgi:ABC-2 type transport system ATP-binding protein